MKRDSRFIYDSNGKQIGLNWAQVAPAFAEGSERPSVRATLPPEPSERKSRRGPVSPASLANLTNTASRKYDYQEIARLWSEGKGNEEIMATVGCGQSTVRHALKVVKPEGYTGKSGPRRIDKCQNGHDMKVHGKEQKRGGRMCMECKRARERVAWKKKQGER